MYDNKCICKDEVIEKQKASSWPLFAPAASIQTATTVATVCFNDGDVSSNTHMHVHTACTHISMPASWSDGASLIELIPTSGSVLSREVWPSTVAASRSHCLRSRLKPPDPSVAHVDCKAVYWETMGSRLCCQAPLITIISITLQSLWSWTTKP